MKKALPPIIIAISLFFSGCTIPPEKYFDTAVLSSNMLHGFANETDWRELQSPSITMVGNSGETAPMKRKEIVEFKIQHAEENLDKITDLKETAETREMLMAAEEMYQHALPVYKKEYVELAKLFDNSAATEQINAAIKSIQDKYAPVHERLHAKLISLGKVYAKKHNINVMWDIQTSPQ